MGPSGTDEDAKATSPKGATENYLTELRFLPASAEINRHVGVSNGTPAYSVRKNFTRAIPCKETESEIDKVNLRMMS